MNVWIAFFAGFASFISPCCLPLYPSYLSYITGISVTELRQRQTASTKRFWTVSHAVIFMLGFSVVYYTLGYGTNIFADTFSEYEWLVRQISAVFIVLMGLFLLGIFQPQLLLKERRWNRMPKKSSYIGSFVFGIGFSAGWTPCLGPVLGAILAMAATDPGAWFMLITAYSLGFGVPFVVLALYLGTARWLLKYSSVVMKVGGGVMILMGILLFTDQMTRMTNWLNMITPNWLKF